MGEVVLAGSKSNCGCGRTSPDSQKQRAEGRQHELLTVQAGLPTLYRGAVPRQAQGGVRAVAQQRWGVRQLLRERDQAAHMFDCTRCNQGLPAVQHACVITRYTDINEPWIGAIGVFGQLLG